MSSPGIREGFGLDFGLVYGRYGQMRGKLNVLPKQSQLEGARWDPGGGLTVARTVVWGCKHILLFVVMQRKVVKGI